MLLLERCDCDLGSLIYPKAGSEEEGQLSAPLMMKIATEMADGLAYLHSRGIKHLDMKPGNVLMVREGAGEEGWSVRIADFGMQDDKEDDGDRQSKDDDEVYGTWECVATAAAVMPFASLAADSACLAQVHGAGVPQPQVRPPRIRLRCLQRRHHPLGGKEPAARLLLLRLC